MGAARKAAEIVAAFDALKGCIPIIEDEVTVRVEGQPGCTKQQLYFLALAAANGVAQRYQSSGGVAVLGFAFPVFLAPPPGMLMIEYNADQNYVQATIRYTTTLLPVLAAGPLTTTPTSFVAYAGPSCDVVGAPFNFTGRATPPGIPASSRDSPAPQLPWTGRTILTPCPMVAEPIPGLGPPTGSPIPTPNPKPPGDNRSRGVVFKPDATATLTSGGTGNPTFGTANPTSAGACCPTLPQLLPLVFAALSDPGSMGKQLFPNPRGGPRGT